MLDWLKKNKRFIKVRAIEQELKMPDSTLIKHINGAQKMSDEWTKRVNEFIAILKK